MKPIQIHPFSVLIGACVLGALFILTAMRPVQGGLTDEQAEILSHMSIRYAPDGVGGTSKTILITGVNVQIVNGLGATNGNPADPDGIGQWPWPGDIFVNGLGNLVVGYNELGNPEGDDRTGSHNIVVGHGNNYTSFGGIVGPHDSEISGPFATVTGGSSNRASAPWCSVSGGYGNTASLDVHGYGAYCSVSGGYGNTASGWGCSVSGGLDNTADGVFDSVSGGEQNTAGCSGSLCGVANSVSGGRYNAAQGEHSSVSGGTRNYAIGSSCSVSGGYHNFANGYYSSVSGGYRNSAGGDYSSVSGGQDRSVSGDYDWRGGGYFSDY